MFISKRIPFSALVKAAEVCLKSIPSEFRGMFVSQPVPFFPPVCSAFDILAHRKGREGGALMSMLWNVL